MSSGCWPVAVGVLTGAAGEDAPVCGGVEDAVWDNPEIVSAKASAAAPVRIFVVLHLDVVIFSSKAMKFFTE
jgi:hypothetical protein